MGRRALSPGAAAAVSPARLCAYAVVRRVFEQGAYADRAFHAEAEGLDPRERSFAMALAYGTIQRRATLDHVAARLLDRPVTRLDPPVLAGLRLGLLQLLLLDGVADHAAVHESVELVKPEARSAGGLVNAVLRRAAREGAAIIASLNDDTPAHAAVLHSVPPWLAELWWRELGPDAARAQLAAVNRPAESALRVNTLVATPDEVLAALGVPARIASPALGGRDGVLGPEAIALEAPLDVYGSPLWEHGAVMPQSRGSMAVSRMLAPVPGERVLDLCAAPGAKTTHLAALLGGRGTVVAVERHAGRARALRRTLERMRVRGVTVVEADAGAPLGDAGGAPLGDAGGAPLGDAGGAPLGDGRGFDRVLVDPPCSGLGTLQARPDLRWRVSPEAIAQLAAGQARILAAGAAALVPGGTLVYSVCTISRAESEAVIDGFLGGHPDFVVVDVGRGEPSLRTNPASDGTDGFFVARLARR